MRKFNCTFTVNTKVQTHGRDNEGARVNVDKFINQDVISVFEEILGCGIDYDRDNVETTEVENGWFELNLKWYGDLNLDSDCECSAIKTAKKMLDDKLTPFYQGLENMSTKNRRFAFINMGDETIDGAYKLS